MVTADQSCDMIPGTCIINNQDYMKTFSCTLAMVAFELRC